MIHIPKLVVNFLLLGAILVTLNGCLFSEFILQGTNLREEEGSLIVSDETHIYQANAYNFVNTSYKTSLLKIDLFNGDSSNYLGTTSPSIVDGTGSAVRFNSIKGMVSVPGTKKINITDDCTIRSLDTQTNTVTTLFGSPSTCGDTNGVGTSATFSADLRGIAYNEGVLYVADGKTVRKIDLQTSQVPTLAGVYNTYGDQDGVGTNALFGNISAIAYLNGNLFLSDTLNKKIKKMSLNTLEVSTVIGDGTEASTDGYGTQAQVNPTIENTQFTTDGVNFIFFTEKYLVRKINSSTMEVKSLIDSRDSLEDIDGPLSESKLFHPTGIAYSSEGLFISNFYGLRRLR